MPVGTVVKILRSVGQSLRGLTESRQRESVGVTEISEQLDINVFPLRRILATLQACGCAKKVSSGNMCQLGPAMAQSADIASIAHCVEEAQSVTLRLRDMSDEITRSAVLQGSEANFMTAVDPRRTLGLLFSF